MIYPSVVWHFAMENQRVSKNRQSLSYCKCSIYIHLYIPSMIYHSVVAEAIWSQPTKEAGAIAKAREKSYTCHGDVSWRFDVYHTLIFWRVLGNISGEITVIITVSDEYLWFASPSAGKLIYIYIYINLFICHNIS